MCLSRGDSKFYVCDNCFISHMSGMRWPYVGNVCRSDLFFLCFFQLTLSLQNLNILGCYFYLIATTKCHKLKKILNK